MYSSFALLYDTTYGRQPPTSCCKIFSVYETLPKAPFKRAFDECRNMAMIARMQSP